MISKIIAQSDRQQKSEKPQESGILQRANVRLVADAGIQSTDDQEEVALSNSTFSKDFSRVPITTTKPQPIMAKLTIGAVGDKYEQEADRVAAQVVQRINAPASLQSGEDETVQREDMETEDNEARLMRSPILQRMSSDGRIAATSDLEASINQARGGGQPMANNIRQPMEKAFGVDFSGVKVHTDAHSDQLNQSIQARAFTTGQNVFFRQGEYNPGSRGGQELIAHELTHVVQQNVEVVQRTKSSTQQTNEQQDVSEVTQSRNIPELVHFIWIGKNPTKAAVENIQKWVESARNTNWKIYLWTDKRKGAPSTFSTFMNQWPKGVISMDILDTIDPRLESGYERSVKKSAYNMASDIARYSILHKWGGVYADVDIGPGQVSLRDISESSALIAGEMPLFGAGLRDNKQLNNMVPPRTEATLRERVAEAITKMLDDGIFGNHFIVTPSRDRIIDNIIIACADQLSKIEDEDIEPNNAMMLTGPTIVQREIESYLRENNIDSSSVPRVAIERMNPILSQLFTGLDWLTEESENQMHR
ncbi:eCIS core domain-containing protein [Nostoc sp.]|uniref:eCIS core domain-containing protein n=1 Tax=Nostoc sp. TaxID=1180 RepID=UPI002FF6C446